MLATSRQPIKAPVSLRTPALTQMDDFHGCKLEFTRKYDDKPSHPGYV